MPSRPKPLPPAYDDPDYKKMSAHFDEVSDFYLGGNFLFRAIHDSAHRRVAAWVKGDRRQGWVCDIGCGQGTHRSYFKGDPSSLIEIDIRLSSLRRIRNQRPDAILIQADATCLPFRTASIESLVSVYTLEHLYYLKEAVAESSRIVAGEGRFFVGIPCEGGLAWNLGRKLTSERVMSKKFDLDYGKYIALEHCNTAIAIVDELLKSFRIIRSSFFPLGWVSMISTNLTLTLELAKLANGKAARP